MRPILVTGGAGAIGANLVAALVAAGEDVVVLDDLSSGRREDVPAGVRVDVGSVADEATVQRAFDPAPRAVVHLAALFANQNSVERPVDDLLANGLGTLRVLEQALRAAVPRVVVCSSSCVYGEADSGDEHFAPATDTPYAIHKGLAESYARYYARQHGLGTLVVRPFNVYGPGERPGRYRNVIPNFLRLALDGEPLPITGTGEETRDFTFVDDVVRGLVAAIDADADPGAAVNLASGSETRIIDLARRINELTGNAAGVVFHERRTWDGTARRRGDLRAARRILGYEPRTPLEEGLPRTLAWLRSLDG